MYRVQSALTFWVGSGLQDELAIYDNHIQVPHCERYPPVSDVVAGRGGGLLQPPAPPATTGPRRRRPLPGAAYAMPACVALAAPRVTLRAAGAAGAAPATRPRATRSAERRERRPGRRRASGSGAAAAGRDAVSMADTALEQNTVTLVKKNYKIDDW